MKFQLPEQEIKATFPTPGMKQNQEKPVSEYAVASFYRFFPLPRHALPSLREDILGLLEQFAIRGSMYIASEGINGSLSAACPVLEQTIAALNALKPLQGRITPLYSPTKGHAFDKTKVSIKKEIVSFRNPDANPLRHAGTYLAPQAWNELLAQENLVLLDVRNDYEAALGSFHNAEPPCVNSFGAYALRLEEQAQQWKKRKVAMFCTGGIRCEKASAQLKSFGLNEVFQLEGGILRYLRDIDSAQSRWWGECFVFDRRVSLKHGLKTGSASLCYACRRPLRPPERQNALYREGISCGYCHGKTSDEQKDAFAERQRQYATKQQNAHARKCSRLADTL